MQRARKSQPITRHILPGEPVPALSMPFEAMVFRPRGTMAAAIIVVPAMVFLALIVAVLIAGLDGRSANIVLGIGSGIALGWLTLIVFFARMFLMTVSTNAESLLVTSPWGRQRSLHWQLIDRANWSMGILRLHASDGRHVMILESGLANGHQLLRHIVLRVSPSILGPNLLYEHNVLSGKPLADKAETPSPEITIAAPWFFLTGTIAIAGTVLAAWGSYQHTLTLLLIGVGLGFVGALFLLLLRQTIIITEYGITIKSTGRGPRTLAWSEIALIERMPLEIMLALRGERRVVFLGPFFMSPLRRNFFHAAIQENLRLRGIPLYQRWLLIKR